VAQGDGIDRTRAESFGGAAALYDSARPSYPPALIDALLAGAPRRVLDVGCGTGIAAALLAGRGVSVLGVEVDARMAAVARAKGLEVEVAAFERWEPAGRAFDLLTAAQAWHWVDPVAGPERAAAALRPGGRICVFWNLGDPPVHVRERLAPVYRRLAPELENYSVALGHGEDTVLAAAAALDAAGPFDPSAIRRFPWAAPYTSASWSDLLATHSDHRLMEPSALAALLAAVRDAIDEVGGSFEMPYETLLVEAVRR
jgi:SAM-dependent methyltransferase